MYHFNHYEPTAFKKLVGRHVTRAEALDQLLRAERFVDLYPIVRQAVRCGVESYSIKQLEQFYGFTRRVRLGSAAQPRLAVELALEARTPEALTRRIREAVRGYNEDDCHSTEALRDWLERLRAEAEAAGAPMPRPTAPDGDPSANVSELQQQVEQLRGRLLDGLPLEASQPDHADHGRWLLAYLIDWHRREENADWWDFFRLVELSDEALLDERKAIAGLEFEQGSKWWSTGRPAVRRLGRSGGLLPAAGIEIGVSGSVDVPRAAGASGPRGPRPASEDDRHQRPVARFHPGVVFSTDVVKQEQPQRSVMRLAERVLNGRGTECGIESADANAATSRRR